MPKRVQMTRNKPWRKDNPDAVIVARPSKWGNPYRIGDPAPHGQLEIPDAASAVGFFRAMLSDPELREMAGGYPADFAELKGRDLACWCPLNQPCHADALLEIANSGSVSV